MYKEHADLPVNWIDGMKINKNHFIATDLNIRQQVKNTYLSFVNPYNYGLLLQNNTQTNGLNLVLDIDNQNYVHAKVVSCSAVTRGGTRIEIQENYFSDKELAFVLPISHLWASLRITRKQTFIIFI